MPCRAQRGYEVAPGESFREIAEQQRLKAIESARQSAERDRKDVERAAWEDSPTKARPR